MESYVCYARITGIVVAAGLGAYLLKWLSDVSMHFKKFRLVGIVSDLRCYPLSACSGVSGPAANCTVKGLKINESLDEQFLIGRTTDSDFGATSPRGTVKQYYLPEMRTICASCTATDLLLSVGREKPISFPFNIEYRKASVAQIHRADSIVSAIDLGHFPSDWINEQLHQSKLRLYKVLNEILRGSPGRGTLGNYTFAVEDSIKYVNKKIGPQPPLTNSYFRPNIVLTGTRPLDEASWSYIKINGVCFKVTCSDTRCIATNKNGQTIDWKTPAELLPPMPKDIILLEGYNFTADLGLSAMVVNEGQINVGDPVFAAQ